MRDKHMLLVYISSSSLKKRLTLLYKNNDGVLRDMSCNYPNLIFFEGLITGHHFWRYGAVLPETNFTFWKFITCLPLLAKQVSQY